MHPACVLSPVATRGGVTHRGPARGCVRQVSARSAVGWAAPREPRPPPVATRGRFRARPRVRRAPSRAPPRQTPSLARRSRAHPRAATAARRRRTMTTMTTRVTSRFPRNRNTFGWWTVSCRRTRARPGPRWVCARCSTRITTTRAGRTRTASCGTTGTSRTSTRCFARRRRITSPSAISRRSSGDSPNSRATSSGARA